MKIDNLKLLRFFFALLFVNATLAMLLYLITWISLRFGKYEKETKVSLFSIIAFSSLGMIIGLTTGLSYENAIKEIIPAILTLICKRQNNPILQS